LKVAGKFVLPSKTTRSWWNLAHNGRTRRAGRRRRAGRSSTRRHINPCDVFAKVACQPHVSG